MKNPVKLKLADNQPVIGMWSVISCATNIEILGLSGFDFTILDMEHGAFDTTSLEHCIRAAETGRMAPLVRIPGENFAAVQWALDLGAYGVVFPQVNDVESAKDKIASTKFAPVGHRGFNPFTRFTQFNPQTQSGTGKLDNHFGLNVLIIETPTALRDIDLILQLEDLDVVYLGIYDLSFALGYNGDTRNPDLLRVIENLTRKVLQAGKHVGLMVRSEQDIQNAIGQGVRFLVYSVDTDLIRNAALHIVNQFNRAKDKGTKQ